MVGRTGLYHSCVGGCRSGVSVVSVSDLLTRGIFADAWDSDPWADVDRSAVSLGYSNLIGLANQSRVQ
jgi:hypothetical protein